MSEPSQQDRSNDRAVLQRISIASPCHVDWDSMTGDERKRFCGACKLNVYNISEMSTQDAANFIRQSEGRTCVRFYQRKDGTIITDNCPVGLRKLRDRVRLKVAAIIAVFTWLGFSNEAHAQFMGAIAPQHIPTPQEALQQKTSFFTVLASIVSAVSVLVLAIMKKARPTTIGLTLLAIWTVAGVVIGIATANCYSGCALREL